MCSVPTADMRIENENKIKVQYNVESVETKFHRDLREHMDVLKVKIELPDTKRYMGKIKWIQKDEGTEETALSQEWETAWYRQDKRRNL